MAWDGEPVEVSTAIHNKFGPRADRLLIGYPLAEIAGVVLANKGLDNTHRADLPAFGAGDIINTPTFIDTGPEAPCIEFGNGVSDAHAEIHTASGADVDFPRGTMLWRLRGLDVDGLQEYYFSSGASGGIGRLNLLRRKVGQGKTLQVLFMDAGGVPRNLEYAWDWTGWHTIVVTWGERGLKLYLDGATPVAQDATTDGWKIADGETARLGANHVPVTKNTRMAAFGLWDVQLEESEIADLMDDSELPFRPAPSAVTAFATVAGPIVGRMDRASCVMRCTTGPGNGDPLVLASADVGWRVAYGTDRSDLGDPVDSAVVSAATDINTPLDITLQLPGGPADGQEYFYRAEWTINGTDWFPFPGGTGRFHTRRDPLGGSFSFCIVADPHNANDGDQGKPDPLANGFGVELFEDSTSRKWYANWRTERDLRINTNPDFILNLGDSPFVGEDTGAGLASLDAAKFARMAAYLNGSHLLSKTAAIYHLIGNHDGEMGFRQNARDGAAMALQQQSTIARKRFLPNPTNSTYPEGGENEGDPNVDDTLEWLPANAEPFASHPGGHAGYLDDYVIDAGAENASPLENYYAFTWGDMLVVVLDVLRYTEPGDPDQAIGTGGEAKRSGPSFTFGPKQMAWLRDVLSKSTARWKIVATHHLPGGENIGVSNGVGFYGRGSGINLSTAAEKELHQVCREHGVTAIFKGHDHKFCHVIRDGLNYITCPTPGAPSLTNGTGWNWAEISDSYGTAESEGAELASGGSGSGRAAGIVHMLNVVGYLEVVVTPTTFTINLRQTEFTRELSGDLTETMRHKGRFVGPVYIPSADVVTLSERPEDVGYAALDSDLTGEWWNNPPTDKKGAAVGHYGYDESYGGPNVTLSGTGDAATRVAAVPRTLYTAELHNAPIDQLGRTPHVRSIPLNPNTWQAAADLSLILDGTVTVPSGNVAATAEMRIDKGPVKTLPKDGRYRLDGVDASLIQFRGADGDRVLVVGNTRD